MCFKKSPLLLVVATYMLCVLIRLFEYFILRTDQTFWGEAFVHKLAGIALLFWIAKSCGFSLQQLGFSRKGIWKNLMKGAIWGLLVFAIAYAVETAILVSQGDFKGLDFYVTAYSSEGNLGKQTGLVFLIICILGNIINVIMEEGIFRGLFQRLLERNYTFMPVVVFSSVLFGFWHMVGPVRSFVDGKATLRETVIQTMMYVMASALIGFTFSLMTKLTGNLYMAMTMHFINNSSVNLLHVLSRVGSDKLMIVRIAVAQTLSLLFILIWYILVRKGLRRKVS